jgi:hypothetical protein
MLPIRLIILRFGLLGLLGSTLCTGCSAGGPRSDDGRSVAQAGGDNQVTVQNLRRWPCARGIEQRNITTPPMELSTPLAPTLTASYAIFRGSGQGDDTLPVRTAVLRRELGKAFELSGYYPRYIRQLGTIGGGRYFVIPAFGRAEPTPVEQCAPPALRRKLDEQRRRRLTEPVYCIVEVIQTHVKPLACEPFLAIEDGRRFFRPLVALQQEPNVGLVPDHVASVRVLYRKASKIQIPIKRNAFLFMSARLSRQLLGELNRIASEYDRKHLSIVTQNALAACWDKALAEGEPTKIEWLNGIGKVLRTITRPSERSTSPSSTLLVC